MRGITCMVWLAVIMVFFFTWSNAHAADDPTTAPTSVIGPPAPPPSPGPGGVQPNGTASADPNDKAKKERIEYCTNNILKPLGDLGPYISVGPAVSTQLIRYDLASKKAGFNTSVGAGASIRFYPITKNEKDGTRYYISQIRTDCRATTSDAVSIDDDPVKGKMGEPLFSITPTVYASKLETSGDLNVQPAVLLGFFRDLINVGAGFNLSGTDKGHVFLVFSLGYGFKF